MQIRDMLRIISRGTNITFSRDGKNDGKANHHFLLMVYGLDPDTAQKAAYKEDGLDNIIMEGE